jgi:hypothetical protein
VEIDAAMLALCAKAHFLRLFADQLMAFPAFEHALFTEGIAKLREWKNFSGPF